MVLALFVYGMIGCRWQGAPHRLLLNCGLGKTAAGAWGDVPAVYINSGRSLCGDCALIRPNHGGRGEGRMWA
jgi:hypothetical protein